ncbi:hypothetical protein [Caldisphaera sp.]
MKPRINKFLGLANYQVKVKISKIRNIKLKILGYKTLLYGFSP